MSKLNQSDKKPFRKKIDSYWERHPKLRSALLVVNRILTIILILLGIFIVLFAALKGCTNKSFSAHADTSVVSFDNVVNDHINCREEFFSAIESSPFIFSTRSGANISAVHYPYSGDFLFSSAISERSFSLLFQPLQAFALTENNAFTVSLPYFLREGFSSSYSYITALSPILTNSLGNSGGLLLGTDQFSVQDFYYSSDHYLQFSIDPANSYKLNNAGYSFSLAGQYFSSSEYPSFYYYFSSEIGVQYPNFFYYIPPNSPISDYSFISFYVTAVYPIVVNIYHESSIVDTADMYLQVPMIFSVYNSGSPGLSVLSRFSNTDNSPTYFSFNSYVLTNTSVNPGYTPGLYFKFTHFPIDEPTDNYSYTNAGVLSVSVYSPLLFKQGYTLGYNEGYETGQLHSMDSSWLTSFADSFFTFQFFGVLSVGTILEVMLGITCLLIFLKFLAGG